MFNSPPQVAPINHIKVTQSLQGVAIPLVFGSSRLPALLVFAGDFQSHAESNGGKGKGGKSGLYAYTATFIGALCQGPILGVNSIWDQSGMLPTAPQGVSFQILGAPAAPSLSYQGGTIVGSRTYYVTITYTDANGESGHSDEASITVPSTNVLVVASPPAAYDATGWNVYIGTTSGGEVAANMVGSVLTPIAIGTNYVEPSGGRIVGPIIHPVQPIVRPPLPPPIIQPASATAGPQWVNDLGVSDSGTPMTRQPFDTL